MEGFKMGLIGWAEAPQDGKGEFGAGASTLGASEVFGIVASQEEGEKAIQDDRDEFFDSGEDVDIESKLEEEAETSTDSSGEPLSSRCPERCSAQDELLDIILQLELRKDASTSTLDISRIESHEVVFVLDHASRQESLDYYRIVRSIHAVKHRILQSELPPDTVDCPNLDELIEYVEGLYRAGFHGE